MGNVAVGSQPHHPANLCMFQVSLLTQKLKEHCKVEYQIKTFSGQTHGFVHRKREDCSPEDKPYIEEARRNLLEWLNKYV